MDGRQGSDSLSHPRHDRHAPARPDAAEPLTAGPAHDRAALAASHDPIITIDQHGTVLSASDSIERALGWKPAELIGRNVNLLIPEPHHSAHDGYLDAHRRTGRISILGHPRRLTALHRDGTEIPIELAVSRAAPSDSAEPFFVGVIRDMSAYAAAERYRDTERVRAESEVASQRDALEKAHLSLRLADRMASIGTLAAGLGHDMSNVLLPVRAHLNALRKSTRTAEVRTPELEHIEAIDNSIAYLGQLADGLHYLALDPEARGSWASTTNLAEWWSQVGPLLTKSVPRQVRVDAEFDHDLPEACIPSHALTQAMLNLLVNAGEALAPLIRHPDHPGMVRIRAFLPDPGSPRLHIEVRDNGTGMSEETRRRAFDLFFTTKPRGMGTGLGLALVQKIVHQVGGTIDIASEPGEGATVTLAIPVPPCEKNAALPADDAALAVIEARDDRVAMLLRQMLEAGGIAVSSLTDTGNPRILIVEPQDSLFQRIALWRTRAPRGELILLGRPEPDSIDAWQALRPQIIADPEEFDALRRAIARAIASSAGATA
ncbi:MAG: nitrogen regulation protein NR(II) [Phycisphaerales bacterium JB037]